MENVLVLTEKPSVAKDIATALDKNARSHEGFLTAKNGQMIITYAFGHLYKLSDSIMPPTPKEEDLPQYPSRFIYEPTSSGAKQGRLIKKLLKDVQKVVIATDAGREGELIARLILIESGWKNWQNTFRFWTSEALTAAAVEKGFNSLKPAANFDKYYYSAISRQHSDFILGLNMSRIASMKGAGRWSVGRVQTPVLNILCDRSLERENFKPEEYYVIQSTFIRNGFEFSGNLSLKDDETLSKTRAQEIFLSIKEEQYATVKKIEKEYLKEPAPVLHSLTSLQREANKVYGLTAQQTLDLAQALYEKHKAISYPRTDSNYLSDNDHDLAAGILDQLGHENLKENIQGNKIFNSKKLTDHHALVPLLECSLEGNEGKIYQLIKKRFLAAFSSDFEYEDQKVTTQVSAYEFISKGKKVLRPGWRFFYEVKETLLPAMQENETIGIQKIENLQKWTKAPGEYNDASILKKMEQLNLGTPATRAGILEKLIKVDYLKRDKKALIATHKGRELIQKLQGSDVTSAELTKTWEDKLLNISNSKDYEEFLKEIQSFTTQEVNQLKKLEVSREASPKQLALAKKLAKEKGLPLPENVEDLSVCSAFIEEALDKASIALGKCGICEKGGDLIDIGKGIKCNHCERIVWKSTYGKTLSEKEILSLFTGEEVILKNLKSKAGKTYTAAFKLTEKVEFLRYINQTKK